VKTLIAYATKSGASKYCAELISKEFESPDIIDLTNDANPVVTQYDLIIAGGSVRMGNLHAHLIRFMKANIRKLEKMNIAFFVCCMETGDKLQAQIEKGFPKILREQAIEIAHLGAQLNWDKMGSLEKTIMKKMVSSKGIADPSIDEQKIKDFINKIKSSI